MRGIGFKRPPARLAAALALSALLLALLPATVLAAQVLPRASTGGVKHVHGNSGQLNGVVDPNGLETSYLFQYGPTVAYGQQTKAVAVGKGTKGVKVGQSVIGLLPGYHYRILAIAVNPADPTKPLEVAGKDKSFAGGKSSKLKFNIAKGKESDQVVPYGGTAILTGSLSGLGFAAKGLTLQATPFPFAAAFVQLAGPVLSSRTGTFTFRVSKLTQSTEFRVLTTDSRPLYSSTMVVHVAPAVTLHVRTLGHGRYRFYGTVAPAKVRGTVVIQQLKPQKAGSKREGPKPHTVGSAPLKRAGSKFTRFSVVLTLSGNWRYRAYIKLPKGPLVSGNSANVLVKAPKTATTKHGKGKGHHTRKAKKRKK